MRKNFASTSNNSPAYLAGELRFFSAKQPINRDFQDISQCVQFDVCDGTFLAFQQGERRDTHIDAVRLEFCQELNLFHSQGPASFRDPLTDNILVSKWFLSRSQAITPFGRIIWGVWLDIFGITKYNEINLVFANLNVEREQVRYEQRDRIWVPTGVSL